MYKKNETVDRRVLRTRQRLKDALVTLMAEKEFDGITITDISKHADSNRATFYIHYGKKEDLLEEIIGDIIEGMGEAVQISLLSAVTQADIQSNILRLFGFIADHAEIFKVLHRHVEITNFDVTLKSSLREMFSRIEDENNPKSPVNPGIYKSYISSALSGVIMYWIREGLKYSPKYMAEQVVQIIRLHPISTFN